jgi:excisionase family DNA binding protein
MRKLLTLAQFARWAGLSRSTVYRLRRDGELQFVRLGRALRIDAAEARAWIERRRESQSRAAGLLGKD